MSVKGFRVLRTNHTSFTVSNLDESIGYFCDTLGFELTSRRERDPKLIEQITGVKGADIEVAFIQGPGHLLEMIQYHSPAGRGVVKCKPCDAGFPHIAYDVDNLDLVIAASKPFSFEPLGDLITILVGRNAGSRAVYLQNLDGITIEFIEKRE